MGSERRRFSTIGYCRIPQAGALGKYLLTQIDEPRFAEGAKQRGWMDSVGGKFSPIGYCRIPQAGALGKYLLAQIDEPRFAKGAKQRISERIP